MTCPLTDIARVDLEMRQGDSFLWTVQIPGDVPLEGFTWRSHIRRTARAPEVAGELTVALADERWLSLGRRWRNWGTSSISLKTKVENASARCLEAETTMILS